MTTEMLLRRENEIVNRIMLVKLERKRKKGKPRMSWMAGVEDLRNCDVNCRTKDG
jgi:hypothetical protein